VRERAARSWCRAPQSPPTAEPGHSNPTNRDLRTAGRWAIFAWSREAHGRVRVRVSVRGF
jgi:hypothetical protein